MASRQLGEHSTITRPRPISPAQHSGEQGTTDNESGKGPSPVLSYFPNRTRALSSTAAGPGKIISSAANFPATHLATTSRTTSFRSRSSIPPTHKLSPPLYASPGESYFTPRPTSSGTEARSPAQKRPPASRSSHGIETSTGPPPALSTQRTKSTESIWKHPPAEEFRQVYPPFSPKASITSDAVPNLGRVGHKGEAPVERRTVIESSIPDSENFGSQEGQRPASLKEKTIVATEARLHKQDSSGESDQTQRPYSKNIDLERMSAQLDRVMRRNTATEEIRSQPSQEDLFLNLAHTDSVPENATGRDERRRVGGNFCKLYMLCIRFLLNGLYIKLRFVPSLGVHPAVYHSSSCFNDFRAQLTNLVASTVSRLPNNKPAVSIPGTNSGDRPSAAIQWRELWKRPILSDSEGKAIKRTEG